MTNDDYTLDDEATFNDALQLRDAGNLAGAIAILEELARRRPRKASVVGMLAGMQLDVGDFAGSPRNATTAVELAPRSDLASRILFHALFGVGDVVGAFREAARFRSLKESNEYDRILIEMEADTLCDLQSKPNDPFLIELLGHVRAEISVRPVTQSIRRDP